jgi:hypothetical protein
MSRGKSRGTYKDLAMDRGHVWVEAAVLIVVM